MMLFTVIFVAVVMFFVGLLVGVKEETALLKTQPPKEEEDEDLKKLQKEYQNFLNYDGSVQE